MEVAEDDDGGGRDEMAFDAAPANMMARGGMMLNLKLAVSSGPSRNKAPRLRTDFRETWLWVNSVAKYVCLIHYFVVNFNIH